MPAASLRKGDVVMVKAGEFIPATAKSSRALRRWTNRRSPANRRRSFANRAATGRGDRRHARALRLDQGRVTSDPGDTFLDRMIALVEGAERQKTPNEIALNILLAGADASCSCWRW